MGEDRLGLCVFLMVLLPVPVRKPRPKKKRYQRPAVSHVVVVPPQQVVSKSRGVAEQVPAQVLQA